MSVKSGPAMQYNECLNLIFSASRGPYECSSKERACSAEDQMPVIVEALSGDKYKRALERVNALKLKYSPKSKAIVPPTVVKMEPLTPIDCFLNISLTRRGFRKCKFDGKPFAKITQPLHRRVSFDVFEGLWKIKDSHLERESRPKITRHILERAAKFFNVPLDSFNCRLLTRLIRQFEEEQREASSQLLLRNGPCPIWRVSLRQIIDGLEKTLKTKKDVNVLEVACALTLGRLNVSNWHSPDVLQPRRGKPSWKDPEPHADTQRASGNVDKTRQQVKEYVIFTTDVSWHIYCIK